MKSIGIDGCKKGWFAVELNGDEWSTKIYSNILEMWHDNKDIENIIIDIPIGMRSVDKLERLCDLQARKILGSGRASSVFPAPCRAATKARSYEEAHKINRQMVGRGLSKQTWCIIPKIREVDDLITTDKNARAQIKESHPEIAFWALNNKIPLRNNKKCLEGQVERLDILLRYEHNAKDIYERALSEYLRKDVARDDILDAICMAITGKLAQGDYYHTTSSVIEIDDEGIEMKIVHYGRD